MAQVDNGSGTGRRRALAAAIASVATFGVALGIGGPLLSLLLDSRGVDAAVNGLNAAATFVGVTTGPLLTPHLVRALGIRRLILLCLALDIAGFLLLRVFDGLGPWFALRLALGLVGSTVFTASEAWINLLARDAERGRIIGLYAAALAAGFAIGPSLLSIIGIMGWRPFVVASGIIALAAVPLLAGGAATVALGGERAQSPLALLRQAPFIATAVALFGFYETAVLSLLPVWAVRSGLGDRLGAATVSAVYAGAILLQVPVGWLSDTLPRRRVLQLCVGIGLAGSLLILPSAAAAVPLFLVLAVWGGFATSIYPVALGMAGDRFRGAQLVSANAALVIAYGAGALIGPVLGGVAIDLWNPQGFPLLLAGLFAAFFAMMLLAPRAA